MARRFLVIIMMLLLCVTCVYAQAKRNAYQYTTYVGPEQTTKAITFDYETRDLIIRNDGSSPSIIWVNLLSTTATDCSTETEGCFILPYGEEISLYDFATSGITLLMHTADASPISVIATY